MDMPARQTNWTVERALALPADGNRYEVLDGELFVTPSPADLVFSPRRLVQPDLFVVPSRADGEPRAWSDVTERLLAVEVLSPSTARADHDIASD